MIDVNSRPARWLAVSGVLVAGLCTTTMAWKFGQSLGQDQFDKTVLSTFSVSLDVCKIFALGFAANAYTKGFRLKGVMALIVWVFAVAYSLTCAMGFAALTRSATTGVRTEQVENYSREKAEYDRLVEQRDQTRKDKLFERTSGCSSATKKDSQDFCQVYWYLDKRIAEIQPNISGGLGGEADPQVALLAKLADVEPGRMANMLAIFLALVAEIVTSIGTYAFSKSTRAPGSAHKTAARGTRPKLVASA